MRYRPVTVDGKPKWLEEPDFPELKTLLIVRDSSPTQGKKSVWRVMVPERYNDGQPVPIEVHREWEDKVVHIARGWTKHAVAEGAWLKDGASLPLIEDMRPVDIVCTEEQIRAIVALTGTMYRQKVIFRYKVADHYAFTEIADSAGTG